MRTQPKRSRTVSMGERWRKEEREAKAEARAGEVQSQAGREEES